ncbi:putative quinol monooxygenase [Kushneria aurantia]|uniref:Quinol monooxygenase n=1 Tax=Kushneria aurantia TaxID=504092 RepID=A0ABV6G2P9_9GAMM|nr:antibiotic biosynthesis monooxygenase family protein [Kushneria aurantia]
MIDLLTRFEARDEEAAARFAERLAEVAVEVLSEPGHVSYAAYRTEEEPRTLFVLERWQTRTDADRHIALSAEGPANQQALALLVGPPHTVSLVPTTPEGTTR